MMADVLRQPVRACGVPHQSFRQEQTLVSAHCRAYVDVAPCANSDFLAAIHAPNLNLCIVPENDMQDVSAGPPISQVYRLNATMRSHNAERLYTMTPSESLLSCLLKFFRRLWLELFVILALATVMGGCTMGYAGQTPIAYMPVSTGTTILPFDDAVESRIDIYSESGIGEAIFWIMDKKSVDDMVLRLHLRGLEQLTLTLSDHTVQASVSSHGDNAVRESLVTADGVETPISPDSPFWIEIVASDLDDGMPAFFDVELPAGLVNSDNSMFRLKWIDFYR